jgi:23S rRNA (cytidine1920-2'-O)/16S rRNA (cytidine1409-2'-O)-methyltransferase
MAPPVKEPRERVDKLLVDAGLAQSRERARALILAGLVLADERPVTKPGQMLPRAAVLRLRGEDIPYVSRGGLKLARALEHFRLHDVVRGAVCLDVGASTGGFTDCLLQTGAARVYAVDVGYGQLAWKLRQDVRVRVLERQNIRALEPAAIPEPIALAVIDVSFISLRLVLPRVAAILGAGRPLVALVKPQFEAGRKQVGKGGVVRDEAARAGAVAHVVEFALASGWTVEGPIDSPIRGASGNLEYLLLVRT